MKKGPPRIDFSYAILSSHPIPDQIRRMSVRRYVAESLRPGEHPQSIPAGATLTIGDDATHACPLNGSGLVAQSFPLLTCLGGEYYLLMNESMRAVIELCPGDERILDKQTLPTIGCALSKQYRESLLPHMTDVLYLVHLTEGTHGVVMIGHGIICFSVRNDWEQVPTEIFIKKHMVPPTTAAQRKFRDDLIEADKLKKAPVETGSTPDKA